MNLRGGAQKRQHTYYDANAQLRKLKMGDLVY